MFPNQQDVAGKGKVYIKAITDSTINGVAYKKLEPIVILDNAVIQINYNNSQKTATNKHIKMATNEIKPTSILIMPESFTPALYKLLGEFISGSHSETKHFLSAANESGTVYLIDSEGIDEDSIFIYDENRNKVSGFEYVSADNSVINLTADTNYLIVYSVTINSSNGVLLKSTNAPYLRLEIELPGNLKSTTLYIVGEKTSFTVEPQIVIDAQKIMMPVLNFTLINDSLKLYY